MRIDKLVPKPGDANAVEFWAWVMAVGPILAGVAMLTTGWLLGAFVDFRWVDQPVNFVQAITILGTAGRQISGRRIRHGALRSG